VSVADEVPVNQATIARLVHLGFEGVVFKRRTSRYRPGERSGSWRKLKARHTMTGTPVATRPDRGRGVERVLVRTADGRVHACAVWPPALATWFKHDRDSISGLEVSVVYSRVDANGALREARVQSVVGSGVRGEDVLQADDVTGGEPEGVMVGA
jgi:hypothetical protein